MAQELEQFVEKLKELTSGLEVEVRRPRPTRVYLDLAREDVPEVGRILYREMGARFATASGSDIGDRLDVVYHFCYDPAGLVVNLRGRAPKDDPVFPSMTPAVPPAEWIEREIMDLLGAKFDGHPRPERLILADDWPEGSYPLREEGQDE